MRPLVAVLLALFQALQRLVDAHRQELDHQVRDAQPALEFLDGFRSRGELEQDVSAFAVPVHFVGQLALAPFFHFVHRAAGVRDSRLHLLDECVHLFVRRVRFRYKQLFVDSHASSFEALGATIEFRHGLFDAFGDYGDNRVGPIGHQLLQFLMQRALERRQQIIGPAAQADGRDESPNAPVQIPVYPDCGSWSPLRCGRRTIRAA
jgi:hypothetical protein